MTPGSMQVVPLNSVERLYNILCLIFGMVIFSTLVSSISAQLTQVRMAMQGKKNTLATLRLFLFTQNLSKQLVLDVTKQVEDRLSRRKPVCVKDVEAIDLLAHPMRVRLHTELSGPYLLAHNLFFVFAYVDPRMIHRLCCEACAIAPISAGDQLFPVYEHSDVVYVLISGVMHYTQKSRRSGGEHEENIEVGSWLCEVALWCLWRHVGTTSVVVDSHVFALQIKDFVRVLKDIDHAPVAEIAWEYAQVFHSRLSQARPPVAPWPSTGHQPRLSTMSTAQYMPHLSAFLPRSKTGLEENANADISGLMHEVVNGRCATILDKRGGFLRLLNVVVVELMNPDGQLLVRLGKWSENGIEAACKIPGRKQNGDSLAGVLDQILHGEMAPFLNNVTFHQVVTEVSWKFSARYKVNTKYIRNVHHADLDPLFDCSSLPLAKIEPSHDRATCDKDLRVCDNDIMVLSSEDKVYLCAWLNDDEMDFFTSEAGSSQLHHLLTRVQIDAEVLEKSQYVRMLANRASSSQTIDEPSMSQCRTSVNSSSSSSTYCL